MCFGRKTYIYNCTRSVLFALKLEFTNYMDIYKKSQQLDLKTGPNVIQMLGPKIIFPRKGLCPFDPHSLTRQQEPSRPQIPASDVVGKSL